MAQGQNCCQKSYREQVDADHVERQYARRRLFLRKRHGKEPGGGAAQQARQFRWKAALWRLSGIL
jgi:hypothetical protein